MGELSRRLLLTAAAFGLLAGTPARAADTTLNVLTAGDQNMVDYVNEFLAPRFEAQHPGVRVQAAGTGPGDAGSQKIYEKLDAQAKAGRTTWDIDVAVVHQKMAGQMVKEDLLAKYRGEIDTGKLVSRETAENALGQDVGGYVMPMFHSQIAIAYNPELVKDPPKNYRRAGRVGEGEPQGLRLQRHQGRHVGRRLRHRLGRGQQRLGPQAREGSLRPRREARAGRRRWRASTSSTGTSP